MYYHCKYWTLLSEYSQVLLNITLRILTVFESSLPDSMMRRQSGIISGYSRFLRVHFRTPWCEDRAELSRDTHGFWEFTSGLHDAKTERNYLRILAAFESSLLDSMICRQSGIISGYSRFLRVHFRTPCRPWAAIYPPSPPPRGIFQGYIFLNYTKCYKMSHVSTLAVGAFRIFGVKREEIMQKSLKIGNNF